MIDDTLKNDHEVQETTPENDQEVQETPQEQPEQQVQQAQPPKETDGQKNFRALREKTERIERERDEAMRRLQEYERSKQPQQEEPEYNVGADELVEGKHLKSYDKKMRDLQQKLAQQEQRIAETTAEARISQQYPDFTQIVNKDTLQALSESEPELAQTLNATNDLYTKAVSAYKMIKKMGLQPQENPYAQDVANVQKNAAKPRPVASIAPQQGDSPLSRANAFANGLTNELKEQLYKEMMEAKNRY